MDACPTPNSEKLPKKEDPWKGSTDYSMENEPQYIGGKRQKNQDKKARLIALVSCLFSFLWIMGMLTIPIAKYGNAMCTELFGVFYTRECGRVLFGWRCWLDKWIDTLFHALLREKM